MIQLRAIQESDLQTFFEHQLDPDAVRMAAFPSRDQEAFFKHWKTKILANPENIAQAILVDGSVVGNLLSWTQYGQQLVGYWIGKEHWGKGYATLALSQFLSDFKARPLYAYVAAHNAGSIRVLEKCGFVPSKEHPQSGEEIVLALRSHPPIP